MVWFTEFFLPSFRMPRQWTNCYRLALAAKSAPSAKGALDPTPSTLPPPTPFPSTLEGLGGGYHGYPPPPIHPSPPPGTSRRHFGFHGHLRLVHQRQHKKKLFNRIDVSRNRTDPPPSAFFICFFSFCFYHFLFSFFSSWVEWFLFPYVSLSY